MDRLVKKKTVPKYQGKDISVMAWIEDAHGQILTVKQTAGKKLWTLPGGKVRRNESLTSALKREILEETGFTLLSAMPVDFFDRYQKGNLTVLFRVLIKKTPLKQSKKRILEISDKGFKATLPLASTPSMRYFWKRAQLSLESTSPIHPVE